MLTYEVDVVQHGGPYVDVTGEYDISVFAKQWDADGDNGVLETRMLTIGETADALDRGLDALRSHTKMRQFTLLRREGRKALVRSTVEGGHTLAAIRESDGYVTGPFEVHDGREMWRVGFDDEEVAERALSHLDQRSDVTVQSRERVNLEDHHDVLQNADVLGALVKRCRDLSAVERETLVTAVKRGYFERPREADLASLAEEFDISKTAVSKNLRRSQRKILREVVDTIEAVDDRDIVQIP